MDVFYDPELPATHRLAWEQIELLRDGLPARLRFAGGQVRETVELLRAHGLAAALDVSPDDCLELADELQAAADRVCAELAATNPQPLSLPLSVPLSWDDWRPCGQEDA